MPPTLEALLKDLHPSLDLASGTPFHAQAGFDSLAIIGLVTRLEEAFGITVFPEDLIPENFESLATLKALVRRNGGDGGPEGA
jgi:acyl carrier protein